MYLVTGATGFIGKKLVKALDDRGSEVRVVSRKQYRNYETVTCDFEKELIPKSTLDSIHTVFHLAGFAHDARDAKKSEHIYRRINVDATVRLAELALKAKVKRFVFISSVKAGGSGGLGICLDESNQKKPDGIYGVTKREAELRLLDIGKGSEMFVSIIRPSLVYGPNVKGNLKLMLAGIKKGWLPPLPETGNKRSMIHVDDLVRAILLVVGEGCANREIFIATDGSPHSSREIYNSMCSVLGKPIPKWSFPKILFNLAALINPDFKYRVRKLLGDECYSPAKLKALGFTAQKTLKEMNETDF